MKEMNDKIDNLEEKEHSNYWKNFKYWGKKYWNYK